MKKLLGIAVCFLLLGGAASTAVAQGANSWPSKPVKIVVPFLPGGSVDTVARMVAERLTQKWGQSVVVENRAGGASNIAAAFVAGADPDGYTLLWSTPGPLVINKMLFRKLSYEPEKFVPISLVFSGVNVFLVPKGFASSMVEFVQKAKAAPDTMTYASTGTGTTTHLSAELFKRLAGVQIEHAPYKGSPAAFPDLITGRVQMFLMALDSSLPFIRNGSVQALAVGGEKRSPQIAGVPTLSETWPRFTSSTWSAIVAPAGTPAAIVDKISQAVTEIIQRPDVTRALLEAGNEPVGGGPDEVRRVIERDRVVWRSAVDAAGIVPQ